MIATLLLAAALLAPGATGLPASHPATTVARVIAACAALPESRTVTRRSLAVDRRRTIALVNVQTPAIVPVVLTTQLRR
ncbi:MAG TPA: hypothetical protein VID19_00050 [Candidatus Eremiobacteraceae bacterium]|jgi:hypothetical protein